MSEDSNLYPRRKEDAKPKREKKRPSTKEYKKEPKPRR